MDQFWSVFFDDEAPSHDTLSVKGLADEILMVGADLDLLPK